MKLTPRAHLSVALVIGALLGPAGCSLDDEAIDPVDELADPTTAQQSADPPDIASSSSEMAASPGAVYEPSVTYNCNACPSTSAES